jgi:hypothetical protein
MLAQQRPNAHSMLDLIITHSPPQQLLPGNDPMLS